MGSINPNLFDVLEALLILEKGEREGKGLLSSSERPKKNGSALLEGLDEPVLCDLARPGWEQRRKERSLGKQLEDREGNICPLFIPEIGILEEGVLPSCRIDEGKRTESGWLMIDSLDKTRLVHEKQTHPR